MNRDQIIDPFFRALFDTLAPEIDKRMAHLAAGSAALVDGARKTVAENYASECATIAAYGEVLRVCEEIQANIYGGRKEEPPTQQET